MKVTGYFLVDQSPYVAPKSLAVFSYLWQSFEIFGKWLEMFVLPLEIFWGVL